MKTPADEILEKAIAKYGVEAVLRGVRMTVVKPIAALSIALILTVAAFGVSIFAIDASGREVIRKYSLESDTSVVNQSSNR